jgi:hypothetical protein
MLISSVTETNRHGGSFHMKKGAYLVQYQRQSEVG